MHTRWYCRSCEEAIESEAVADHEEAGHDVKGLLRPERLLSNDPWTVGGENRPPDAGPTSPEDGGLPPSAPGAPDHEEGED